MLRLIDKIIEIGRCYGMEMNVKKTKVMRISRQPFPVTIMYMQGTNFVFIMWNLSMLILNLIYTLTG
jgi:hypothetical protein